MVKFEHRRAITLIKDAINSLSLDLNGYEILTEVGSNYYLYLPLIGALAGARKVNAWTRDSIYGDAKNIKNECTLLARELGVLDKINIETNNRPKEQIGSADIVTNSGFLRPIDRHFIDNLKPTAVIPLMYEAWEYRSEDVDARYCCEKKIQVAGTWEDHPSIRVFEKIGILAIKLALQGGYEITQNKILIWSNDNFGSEAFKAFKSLNPSELYLTNTISELMNVVHDLDFIFLCDYKEESNYFEGPNPVFDLKRIQDLNSKLGIIHLYGELNSNYLAENGVHCYPSKNGKSKVMSETLGYVGLLPIINLQAAGLKVGEHLLKGENTNSLLQLIELGR